MSTHLMRGKKLQVFATTYTTSPISPQLQHDFEDFLSVDGIDLDSIHYSPFLIQDDSDDNALLTQRHLKDLNAKPDTLIPSFTTSSSQAYSKAAVKSMLDTLVKEHAANLAKENQTVADSTISCQQVTIKVDKLISETKTFMTELHTIAGLNISKDNDAISKLSTSLRIEREKQEQLCIGISNDNTALHTSVSSRLTKFQDDLAVESKIMDELALRTTQLRAQSIKLKHANKEIKELNSERAVMETCVGDVNSLLSNLLEAHDSILTISVRRHLADKLCPAFTLLNRLVLE